MAMFGPVPGAFPASGAEGGPPPGYGWFWGMMGGPGGASPGAVAHAGQVSPAGPGTGDDRMLWLLENVSGNVGSCLQTRA